MLQAVVQWPPLISSHFPFSMVSDLQKIPTHAALIHTDSDSSDSACSPTHLTFPNCGVDDLTPTSSPVLPQRGHRQRLVSVSNPEPVMKLVVDGFMRKVRRNPLPWEASIFSLMCFVCR